MNLEEPLRQSAKGIVLLTLIGIGKFIKAFWALILIYIVKEDVKNFLSNNHIIILLSSILVLIIVNAILSYLYFKFYVKNNELIVTRGYIKKTKLSIPIDRIQTINIKQNIIQQFLNVVSLQIDTAGSTKKELDIKAVSITFAELLKKELLKHKEENPTINKEFENKETINTENKTILKLNLIDLLKIGISENHLKSFLLIIFFIFGILDRIRDSFQEQTEDIINNTTNYIQDNASVIIISFLIIAGLIITLLYSLIRVILVYFNLTFIKTGNGFQLQQGLLNKKNISILINKIQIIKWQTNPIRKALNFYNVKISQVDANINQKNDQKIIIPSCDTHRIKIITTKIFDNDDTQINNYAPSPRYILKCFYINSILLIPLFIWSLFNPLALIICIVWLFLSIAFAIIRQKKYAITLNENSLFIKNGIIGTSYTKMKLYKIQGIEFKQSIFIKRYKLASVKINTANNESLIIPFIKEDEAKKIINYILYKCESSHVKWF